MKALILILATAFTLQAQSAKEGKTITEWKLVVSDEKIKSYYAPKTVSRSGNKIKTWVKFEFPNGSDLIIPGTQIPFGALRAYAVLDCKQNRLALVTMIGYDDRGVFVAEKERVTGASAGEKPNNMTAATLKFSANGATSQPLPPS